MSPSQKIFKDLRQFFRVASQNPENYRNKPTDFTRKGKLHFGKLCLMMCSLLKSHCKANSTRFSAMGWVAPNRHSAKHAKSWKYNSLRIFSCKQSSHSISTPMPKGSRPTASGPAIPPSKYCRTMKTHAKLASIRTNTNQWLPSKYRSILMFSTNSSPYLSFLTRGQQICSAA